MYTLQQRALTIDAENVMPRECPRKLRSSAHDGLGPFVAFLPSNKGSGGQARIPGQPADPAAGRLGEEEEGGGGCFIKFLSSYRTERAIRFVLPIPLLVWISYYNPVDAPFAYLALVVYTICASLLPATLAFLPVVWFVAVPATLVGMGGLTLLWLVNVTEPSERRANFYCLIVAGVMFLLAAGLRLGPAAPILLIGFYLIVYVIIYAHIQSFQLMMHGIDFHVPAADILNFRDNARERVEKFLALLPALTQLVFRQILPLIDALLSEFYLKGVDRVVKVPESIATQRPDLRSLVGVPVHIRGNDIDGLQVSAPGGRHFLQFAWEGKGKFGLIYGAVVHSLIGLAAFSLSLLLPPIRTSDSAYRRAAILFLQRLTHIMRSPELFHPSAIDPKLQLPHFQSPLPLSQLEMQQNEAPQRIRLQPHQSIGMGRNRPSWEEGGEDERRKSFLESGMRSSLSSLKSAAFDGERVKSTAMDEAEALAQNYFSANFALYRLLPAPMALSGFESILVHPLGSNVLAFRKKLPGHFYAILSGLSSMRILTTFMEEIENGTHLILRPNILPGMVVEDAAAQDGEISVNLSAVILPDEVREWIDDIANYSTLLMVSITEFLALENSGVTAVTSAVGERIGVQLKALERKWERESGEIAAVLSERLYLLEHSELPRQQERKYRLTLLALRGWLALFGRTYIIDVIELGREVVAENERKKRPRFRNVIRALLNFVSGIFLLFYSMFKVWLDFLRQFWRSIIRPTQKNSVGVTANVKTPPSCFASGKIKSSRSFVTRQSARKSAGAQPEPGGMRRKPRQAGMSDFAPGGSNDVFLGSLEMEAQSDDSRDEFASVELDDFAPMGDGGKTQNEQNEKYEEGTVERWNTYGNLLGKKIGRGGVQAKKVGKKLQVDLPGRTVLVKDHRRWTPFSRYMFALRLTAGSLLLFGLQLFFERWRTFAIFPERWKDSETERRRKYIDWNFLVSTKYAPWAALGFLVTIVETSGATFKRAGLRMLGVILGTASGWVLVTISDLLEPDKMKVSLLHGAWFVVFSFLAVYVGVDAFAEAFNVHWGYAAALFTYQQVIVATSIHLSHLNKNETALARLGGQSWGILLAILFSFFIFPTRANAFVGSRLARALAESRENIRATFELCVGVPALAAADGALGVRPETLKLRDRWLGYLRSKSLRAHALLSRALGVLRENEVLHRAPLGGMQNNPLHYLVAQGLEELLAVEATFERNLSLRSLLPATWKAEPNSVNAVLTPLEDEGEIQNGGKSAPFQQPLIDLFGELEQNLEYLSMVIEDALDRRSIKFKATFRPVTDGLVVNCLDCLAAVAELLPGTRFKTRGQEQATFGDLLDPNSLYVIFTLLRLQALHTIAQHAARYLRDPPKIGAKRFPSLPLSPA